MVATEEAIWLDSIILSVINDTHRTVTLKDEQNKSSVQVQVYPIPPENVVLCIYFVKNFRQNTSTLLISEASSSVSWNVP